MRWNERSTPVSREEIGSRRILIGSDSATTRASKRWLRDWRARNFYALGLYSERLLVSAEMRF